MDRFLPVGAGADDADAAHPGDCAPEGPQPGMMAPDGTPSAAMVPDEAGDARTQLLDAASAIMCQGDIEDVSLSELSRRSGLNSALVKYYFGNKAGLLRALIDREWSARVRQVETLLARDFDPETKLRIHMAGVVDNFFRQPYTHRLLLRMIRESQPAEARRLADSYLKPMLNAYAALIGEGVARGVFRPVDPQLFYFTVIGAADRFFTAQLALRYCSDTEVLDATLLDEGLRDRYRAHLNDFVVAGILVPSA
ncbi:TetR family transcriptional regulator [Novosphingobium bradum]|uniref:TetR family transcriptional regulator n=1 Tax=Novosphingobium bradum TaxID=1737444 RepID=A0ABV7IKB6_9SPHN